MNKYLQYDHMHFYFSILVFTIITVTYVDKHWRLQPHLIQAVLAPPPFCSRRLTTNDDVREELRRPVPVWAEWTEVRLGLLLQLHQPLLRHRPVQRCRVLCRPQLGEGGTEPAAGAHPAAGLRSGKWRGVKRWPHSIGGCGGALRSQQGSKIPVYGKGEDNVFR